MDTCDDTTCCSRAASDANPSPHNMQCRGAVNRGSNGELVQFRATDVGAWYITWFVMTAASREDAFTVLAQEVFVDVLVEFAQLLSHPPASFFAPRRLAFRLAENDLCARSATFFLYRFDPSRREQCLSLALATVAAPVCEHCEARSETAAGEVQRRLLRFLFQCCCGLLQLSQFVLRCRSVLPGDAQGTGKHSCSLSCRSGNLVAKPFCGCCYVLLQWQRLSGQSFWQAGLLALFHDSIAPLRSA